MVAPLNFLMPLDIPVPHNSSKSIQKNPVPQRDLIRDDGDIIHTSSAGHTIHGPCISCTSQLGGWSIVIVQCDDQHSSRKISQRELGEVESLMLILCKYPYVHIYLYMCVYIYNEDY